MYIPLYNKSNYTLLSSLLNIDDIINYAVNNNISSIALSDSNMYGVMEFIKKCDSKNIKETEYEFYELGFDKYIKVSGEQGDGISDLLDLITHNFPKFEEEIENPKTSDNLNMIMIIFVSILLLCIPGYMIIKKRILIK